MQPVMEKAEYGWKCCRCRFETMGMNDALTHATRTHGAEAAWDDEGTIWDAKEPDVLRMAGSI